MTRPLSQPKLGFGDVDFVHAGDFITGLVEFMRVLYRFAGFHRADDRPEHEQSPDHGDPPPSPAASGISQAGAVGVS